MFYVNLEILKNLKTKLDYKFCKSKIAQMTIEPFPFDKIEPWGIK